MKNILLTLLFIFLDCKLYQIMIQKNHMLGILNLLFLIIFSLYIGYLIDRIYALVFVEALVETA